MPESYPNKIKNLSLTKFEFKILQSLANMVWIKNHIRKECEDVNQNYLLNKLDYQDYESQPYYLINQFDVKNGLTLWELIHEIRHEGTKNNLLNFFKNCITDKIQEVFKVIK